MSVRNRLFWSVLALGIVAVLLCARYAHNPLVMPVIILVASFACGLIRPRLFWVGGLSIGLARVLVELGTRTAMPADHGVLAPLLSAIGPLLTYGSVSAAFRFSLVGSVLGALLGNFLESRAERAER